MPRGFHSDVGHFWDLVVRKSGMELTSNSQTVTGTELLKSWRSISLKAVIPFFRRPAPWEEENWKVKVVERRPFTTTEVKRTLNWFFAHLFLSISSVSANQSQTCAVNWNQIKLGSEICESLVIPTENANTNTTSQSSQSAQGHLSQDYFKKIAEFPEDKKLSELCRDLVCEEYREKPVLHYNWRRIWDYADSMSRIHSFSKSWNISTKRMDSFKYEGWSSLRCESLSSRRALLPLLSWSNHCLETKRFRGFALWMVSTSTSQKRQRKYPVRILTRPSAQGNLWQRLNQSQDLLWIQMSMFPFLKESS